MTKKQIAGVTLDLDDEGYMTNHAQWNREVAAALAREEGIELTAAHWKVLDFIDKDFRERMCCNFVVEPKVGVDDRQFSSPPRTDRE